ncbi:dimethyl sulfone monooxygenase SfnG [Paenalkalicoccus suaedae]|uniref:Dimethyl sulfone monooxygenase SfnG n=1 Tax=Paenalkalicoccus suaedae TaxID=2592382 RepID=A0A859FJK3_9BACI|nr:dimethyl sulfone monooxygenase SfnG [Paenalkalicoccus suaedae]QKS72984.1 dimethyl sulfone monooxygenase SfnG [Paenalkalicoccus suaedae]
MSNVQFAYWVPNVSGGLVVSKLPQQTGWDVESNKRYIQLAEEVNYDYALFQTRWFASYGAENQLEAITLASALASVTSKINLIAAVHPGLWHPGVYAKMVATLDNISNGRAALNVVSGWFKQEFIGYGEHWLDHDERYRRSSEFIQVLRELWTKEEATFQGDFYRINQAPLKPKPVNGQPPVFQGGNSSAAREMAAEHSDWYFMNGNTLEGFKEQIEDVRARAKKYGREDKIKFAVNGFAIVRDTKEEAVGLLRDIVANADDEAVKGFREAVKHAGQSASDGQGMWANSSYEDLVQYNDGFKTGLIGTAEEVSERILELKAIGVDLVLTGHFHYETDLQRFGEEVIPLVKQKEQVLARV